MNLRKNKKGAEMTIGTIVIIVLALVVLVVLIVGFTGGWSNMLDKLRALIGLDTENVGATITGCQIACSNNLQYDYCVKEKSVRFGDKSGRDGTYNCRALQEMNLGLSCDKTFESGCNAIKPCRVKAGCPTTTEDAACTAAGCKLNTGTPATCVAAGGKCDTATTEEACTTPCTWKK